MFRVSARTVLQLGAELISSDAVAFYELIKNAFDAGSPKASVRVTVRLPHDAIREAEAASKTALSGTEGKRERARVLDDCKERLAARIDAAAPGAAEFGERLSRVAEWQELRNVLDEANEIEIRDTGSGMSQTDLQDIYLTIGTPCRLKERTQRLAGDHTRAILGEKGLGRLAAMRLGWKLRVVTTRSKEEHWNVLEIDWRRFSQDLDEFIEQIDIDPGRGKAKEDAAESGTIIRITALANSWDAAKLRVIAQDEFSKLTDPFVPKARYPISLTFNGSAIPIPNFNKLLPRYAHAVGSLAFVTEGDNAPRLSGRVDYRLRSREKSFTLEGEHLISAAKQEHFDTLIALGPFTAKFTWVNRKVLKEIEENVEEVATVLKLQEQWAGGLMVYRDGFRVYPYGNPDDDWLDLDKKALASGGYKINRRQLVGRVVISSAANPALLDQSNREGLRDCEEKRVIIRLLKHALEAEFRAFLNKVERDLKTTEPTTFQDLEEHIEQSEERIAQGLRTLIERHPEVGADSEVMSAFKAAIADLNRRLRDAKALAESFDTKHAQVIHLAGTGLMVEMLAHELNRATGNAMATLADAGRNELSPAVTRIVSTLKAELTTLQRRLKILDPLSTTGRQRRETFDLAEWVLEIVEAHTTQFERHGIACRVTTTPKGEALRVKAVKGMIVQVLENLISNSVCDRASC